MGDILVTQQLGSGKDSTLTARFYVDFLNTRFDSRTTNTIGLSNAGVLGPTTLTPRGFEMRQRSIGAQIQHNWKIAPNQTLVYGFDYRNIFFTAGYTLNDPRILSSVNANENGRELRFAGADKLSLGLSYENVSGWYAGLLVSMLPN